MLFRSLKSLDDQIATEGEMALDKQARAEYRTIQNEVTEQWKNHISDEVFGQRLRALVDKYKGTNQVAEILNAKWDPYPKMRSLMKVPEPK